MFAVVALGLVLTIWFLLSSVSLSGLLVDEADLLAGESRFRHLLLGFAVFPGLLEHALCKLNCSGYHTLRKPRDRPNGWRFCRCRSALAARAFRH